MIEDMTLIVVLAIASALSICAFISVALFLFRKSAQSAKDSYADEYEAADFVNRIAETYSDSRKSVDSGDDSLKAALATNNISL